MRFQSFNIGQVPEKLTQSRSSYSQGCRRLGRQMNCRPHRRGDKHMTNASGNFKGSRHKTTVTNDIVQVQTNVEAVNRTERILRSL